MSAAAEPRERLRVALDRALASFADRTATDEQLTLWAGLIERFAEHVEGSPPDHVLWAYSDRGIMAAHGVRSAGEVSVEAIEKGQSIVAEMRFVPRVAGAPAAVHGGDIAAAFDAVMGFLFTAMEPGVVTKRLDVRFLAPAPAGETGTIEARLTETEGRRHVVTAELHAGGRLCATAEGEFVQLR